MLEDTIKSNDTQKLVTVAMCTFKRPQMIETLNSIIEMNLPSNITLEIVVVDNDPEESARRLVKSFSSKFRQYPVVYVSEPRKNISHARNACLSHSNGEWICFIDDDEIADENYLKNLLAAADLHKADVVNGRVIPVFDEDTPSWIIDGGFFTRKRYETGRVIDSCGAGTTLVRASAIEGLQFDEEFGISGGEDSEFFNRAHLNGRKLIYCDEAFVHEGVEENRLNIKYLLLRRFRIGMTYTRYRYSQSSSGMKIKYFAKCFLSAFMLSGLSVITLLLPKQKSYKILLLTSDKYGKIAGLFRKKMPSMY